MTCAGESYSSNQEHSVAMKLLNNSDCVFEPKTIELRYEQVLRMQKYKDLSRVHPEILSITGARFHSKAFEKYIPECDEIAVFVMTLGSALDEIEHDMANSDKLIEAVFLETAGWLGIEQLTKLFSTFLRNQVASDGLRLGRRMSPGYTFRVEGAMCDWPLEDQKLIFDLFDKKKLAVELLDSCAMSPKMSRSGLYGLPRKNGARAVVQTQQ